MINMKPCSLCGRPSRLLNSEHFGYQRPEKYAIYECAYCDLQFADPLHSPNGIYEHIYRNSAVLPGTPATSVTQTQSRNSPIRFFGSLVRNPFTGSFAR